MKGTPFLAFLYASVSLCLCVSVVRVAFESLADTQPRRYAPPMLFHVGDKEIDTEKVRAWVNSSRGRTLAFWLTAVAVVLLPLTAWWAFGGSGKPTDDGTQVVLYTSADEPLVKAVLDAFKAETGVEVKVVTDTEATRGAVAQRLLAEKDRPRADVWWSSEVVGTIKLAQAGVLAPWASKAEATFPGGWPDHLRPADRRWYGFAQRARVIAFNTAQVNRERAPKTLRDLLRPDLAGKVGLANPRFGTTRTHLAYLLHLAGEAEFRAFLQALKDQRVQILPSNSAVVQALGRGDLAVGLTDTDDVWAGQREKWPIDLVYESVDDARAIAAIATKPGKGLLPSKGTLVLPNTVGRVTGSPNAQAGDRLAEFLLSERVERMLAESESRNVPIRPDLAKAFKGLAIPTPANPDYAAVAAAEEAAIRIFDEIFPP
jgi:iron(III) transport system substrate-binding protein